MPLRTLKGIQDALSHSNGAQVVYFLLALAVLAAVIGLFHLLLLHMRKRRRLRAAWGEFARRLPQWKLARPERDLLCALARDEVPWTPVEMLERIEVFERAVHRHLERTPTFRPGHVGQAAEIVRALRAKLGFERPPGTFYYSTREIEPGLRLSIAVPDASATGSLQGRATGEREDYLAVAELHPADKGLTGRKVQVTFFRGMRAFAFSSQVVDVTPENARCLLRHSLEVSSTGLREFHRVPVGKPVAIRASWEDDGVRREGLLQDLSAGGAALLCPCYYETGEEIVVHLAPGAWLGAAAEGEGPLTDRTLSARILATRLTGDGRCVYHVEFHDTAEEDVQYLTALVRRIETGAAARTPAD